MKTQTVPCLFTSSFVRLQFSISWSLFVSWESLWDSLTGSHWFVSARFDQVFPTHKVSICLCVLLASDFNTHYAWVPVQSLRLPLDQISQVRRSALYSSWVSDNQITVIRKKGPAPKQGLSILPSRGRVSITPWSTTKTQTCFPLGHQHQQYRKRPPIDSVCVNWGGWAILLCCGLQRSSLISTRVPQSMVQFHQFYRKSLQNRALFVKGPLRAFRQVSSWKLQQWVCRGFFFSKAGEMIGDKFVPLPQFYTQSKNWVDKSLILGHGITWEQNQELQGSFPRSHPAT